MIISHKHRYIFVELPHTGSTAIHNELCESYEGIPILYKHACYGEFLRVATAEEKKYFVFSGIRNPLDEAVSVYFKYKTDHRGRYSDPRRYRDEKKYQADRQTFEFVTGTNADFPTFLKRFYRFPYDNWSRLAHHKFDFVIRFEHLQEDFAKVLELMGVPQVRPLPSVNKTGKKKEDFLSYYTPDIRNHAKRVFGPFMQKWGYEFPAEWGVVNVSPLSRMQYNTLGIFRSIYWGYLKGETSLSSRLMKGIFDGMRPYASRLFRS